MTTMPRNTFRRFKAHVQGNKDISLEQLVKYIDDNDELGWDGFSQRDMNGVRKFLADFQLYNETMGMTKTTYAKAITRTVVTK
jgi:hypothetical protein